MRTWKALLIGTCAALVSLTLFPAAASAAADPVGTASTPLPTNSLTLLALVSFGVAVLVIMIGLFFSYSFHRRLISLMHYAIEKGLTVTSVDAASMDAAPQAAGGGSGPGQAQAAPAARQVAVQGLDDGVKVLVPEVIEVGKKAVFKLVHLPGNGSAAGVSWHLTRTDGVGPALLWSGSEVEHTFAEAGTYELTVTPGEADAEAYSTKLNVTEPPVPKKPVRPTAVDSASSPAARVGASLQALFSMRNWARFVFTVFGVGTVAALMFAKIISSEGGIGLLGALLGVGATAGADPAPGGGQPPAGAPAQSSGGSPVSGNPRPTGQDPGAGEVTSSDATGLSPTGAARDVDRTTAVPGEPLAR